MKDQNIIDTLNELHQDLIGETMESGLTDLDKIIGILKCLTVKIEKIEDHTHTIS